MLLDPMTCRGMPRRVLAQRRLLAGAAVECDRTARMKAATRRRIYGRGNISGKHDSLAAFLEGRIRNGDRREQRLSVGVERILVELLAVGLLDDFADIHHRDPG